MPAALPTTPAHGRVETAPCKSSPLHEESASLRKQIIRITRERLITATDQRSVEVVYAICSLPFEHARLPRS
ncbi:putative transposase for IS2404 [Mycobacterium ulcerans str. Harvey]|uniref:Transposase for IS2404 n=1 Tax=Mycobacterium ulcerans str. Harvey TaxID=1299332 RepID=A0ABN0R939_MYCUL|nr:putative transposase for IS2404 [Mycobacterium ulcerans str. Harvey]